MNKIKKTRSNLGIAIVTLFLCSILYPPISVYAQANTHTLLKGVVYEDYNKNGRKDRSEKGIVNVGVSNGVEIVYSDAQGRYELPVKDDQIIFVIKPTGYATKTDKHQLSRSYYIHKPKGSPTKEYQGVDPTGLLPKNVDFPLYPQIEDKDFKFLVFGDPQMSHPEDIYYFREGIIEEAKKEKDISFGITLGDIVGNVLQGLPPYIEAVSEIGSPWYNVIGNHDINFDVAEDHLSDETFERLFGPPNVAFNYAEAQFVIMDNVMYGVPKGTTKYTTGFRPDQWTFLENVLNGADRSKLLVMACHIPFWLFNEADRHRLYGLLNGFDNLLLLSAHTHLQQQVYHGPELGWKGEKEIYEFNVGTTCGDWYSGELDERGVPDATMRDGTPKGYAYVEVKDGKYTTNYKVSGQRHNYQIRLFAPKVIRKGRSSFYNFYANFFMGSQRDEVVYRINNGDWKTMDFSPVHDPVFVNKLFNFDNSETLPLGKRSFYLPVNSTHLWSLKFPRELGVGQHTLEVRAKDQFGRYHYATKEFRVEEHKDEPLFQKYGTRSAR